MRLLYTFLFYLLIPFILLRLLWRSRKNSAYRHRLAERFGFFKIPSEFQKGLWVHAVSLGEVIAATTLVKAIHQQHPNLPIVLTTMTITGSEQIQNTLNNEVFHVYVPYDIPFAINNFLNRVNPSSLLILETELWPNILNACQNKRISVMLSNARLSERSFRGYRRIPNTTKKMLSSITVLASHAQADAKRFIDLGMEHTRVFITGSIKFDITTPASIFEQAQVLKKKLGENRHILIAASTHEGEEIKILQAFKKILLQIPDTLLVLVPRHPERFARITEYCHQAGYHVQTRSSQQPCSKITQIFIGDTVGELNLFYATSDVAFVGGSLMPIGGHNILEPNSFGVPTIVGPYMSNFSEITELLLNENAIFQIHHPNELAETVVRLLEDSTLRAAVKDNAEKVLRKNKGALGKNMRLLEEKILNQN